MEFTSIVDFQNVGYSTEHSEVERKFAYENFVIPWLENNIYTETNDLFLSLCLYSFNVIGLPLCSSDDEFDKYFSSFYYPLKQKIRYIISSLSCSDAQIDKVKNKSPKIAFFTNSNSSSNEHAIACLNELSNNPKIECHLIYLNKNKTELNLSINKNIILHNINFVFSGYNITKNFLDLKRKLQIYNFDLAISFCSQVISYILLNLEIAKTNVFFPNFFMLTCEEKDLNTI